MITWNTLDRWWMEIPGTGLCLDISGIGVDSFETLAPAMERALTAMQRLEDGAVANPDEGRQVGHYWLRSPDMAPSPEICTDIVNTRVRIGELAERLFRDIRPTHVLHLGIGGSALGPELLLQAVRGDSSIRPEDYRILDNTDPATFDEVLAAIDPLRTVILVVSKSGGTPETRNAMLRVRKHFEQIQVPFAPRAVAITGVGSALDKMALSEGWAGRLPLWDWVGGRTSLTGPVGLLPAALLGIDGDVFLEGAARMDAANRAPMDRNAAAWLALAWWTAHPRAMVMLPYCDRLRSLGRYLQQLVMESLGKKLDRQGREVRAGLTVYGNKGSTDQHAYVQQLRDGPDDFFACFVEVLTTPASDPVLADGFTASDALHGFLLGTREALREDGKKSLTLTLPALDARSLGAVIALYERAVGIYAELLDINAYHQPGVEAGKKAATRALAIQQQVLAALGTEAATVAALCEAAGVQEPEMAWRILRRLSAVDPGLVGLLPGAVPSADRFWKR